MCFCWCDTTNNDSGMILCLKMLGKANSSPWFRRSCSPFSGPFNRWYLPQSMTWSSPNPQWPLTLTLKGPGFLTNHHHLLSLFWFGIGHIGLCRWLLSCIVPILSFTIDRPRHYLQNWVPKNGVVYQQESDRPFLWKISTSIFTAHSTPMFGQLCGCSSSY